MDKHDKEELNNLTEQENQADNEEVQQENFITNAYEELVNNLRGEVDSLQDKLLRSMAENENIRQRSNKLAEEAREYSITNFARDLVPVIDNLARALEHIPAGVEGEVAVLIEGVNMTKTEMLSVFKKHGLEAIEPKAGEKFDYNKHNAISKITTEEFEEGSIVSTLQVGYKIKDRLLRPAAVTVAKK